MAGRRGRVLSELTHNMPYSSLRRILTAKPIILMEVAVLLFFGWNLGEEILKKRAIEGEIKKLEIEIGKLEAEKDELGELLAYIKTDAFVTSEAREKLSLVPEGERVLVIPDADSGPGAVAPAKLPRSVADSAGGGNVERWWKYFFDHEGMWIE